MTVNDATRKLVTELVATQHDLRNAMYILVLSKATATINLQFFGNLLALQRYYWIDTTEQNTDLCWVSLSLNPTYFYELNQ
ncbi:hypothetical protein [Nostoc sp. TCL26-01]|uniref:hypothetical protein n=1 Tax=Nostoc sp. TCL26-01 TaxID=2576904 RepID=UPI0015BB360F|nr:hypothetical protein [Nostoc sp. TCL26-01]QLE57312.1 hypothetical protein FD725_18365 [Nostoc sp. TCL26-01]